MPLNQYKCSQCNHAFEELQKFSDKVKRKCPQCGKLKLAKLFGAPSFRLIGSGFYANDYKKQDLPN